MSELTPVAGRTINLGTPHRISFRNTFALIPGQWLEAGQEPADAPTAEVETFVAFVVSADADWVYTANQRGADGRYNTTAAISIASIVELVELQEVAP